MNIPNSFLSVPVVGFVPLFPPMQIISEDASSHQNPFRYRLTVTLHVCKGEALKVYLLENYLGILFLYSLHGVSIFVEIHNSNLSEAKNSIAQKV